MSSPTVPILDFKSATLYAVRLVLQTADTPALLQALQSRLQEAGDFFDGEPVVIDALRLDGAADWSAIAKALTQGGMTVVGVAAPDALHAGIRAAGLAAVNLPAARDASAAAGGGSIHRDPATPAPLATNEPGQPAAVPDMSASAASTEPPPRAADMVTEAGIADEAPRVPPGPPADAPRATLILDRSLRSGQKVYARGADLVVVGMVSPGAEVIADGSIHVYGPLRGKAMAGARGDESARIFTTRLNAELVAVAGVYRVVETQWPADLLERPAAVRLHGGALCIDPLSI